MSNTSDNAYHVVVVAASGELGSATLDGFTIIGGCAVGAGSINVFNHNVDQNTGGGVALYTSMALSNLNIQWNMASSNGGGMVCYSGSQLSTSVFTKNLSNTGSAISITGNGSLKMERLEIYNNKNYLSGYGTVDIEGRSLDIKNSLIRDNVGTGIYCHQSSSGVWITNVTVSGNSEKGIAGVGSIYNSIVFGNQDKTVVGENYKYSYIEGSAWDSAWGNNIGNIVSLRNPFAILRSFMLYSTSPAVDVGLSGTSSPGEMDLAGNPRIKRKAIDMGAYEFQELDNPVLSNFPEITKVYGDAAFTLKSPFTNSDGTFTYTSSDESVAVIDGNKVTIIGAGITTIKAVQAGTLVFNPGEITTLLKVAKKDAVISNFSDIDKFYGDAPFNLTAPSSTSNGTFSYISSNLNVAKIDGDKVTLTGAGLATITAVQATTSNFNGGEIAMRLAVSYGYPILTGFSDITKNYGDATFALTAPVSTSNGTFTYVSSDQAIATINGNLVTIKAIGTVYITARQAQTANYNPSSTTLTLTINKANPTLSNFANVSKTYGNATFTLATPTSSSNAAFTYTSSDATVATISGNVVTIKGAGTAVVTATQTATANYNSASIDMTLTVGKANPTLSNFGNMSKGYGSADFALQPLSTGDGVFTFSSSNVNVATVNGSMVTIKNTGSTTITAVQAATDNYNSASVQMVLTVGKGTPVFSNFSNVTISYAALAGMQLAAGSTSTATINYTSNNPSVAAVNGSSLVMGNAGTATITATQTATANYNAGSATITVTINKINPILSDFRNATMVYNPSNFNGYFRAPVSDNAEEYTHVSSNENVVVPNNNNGTYTIKGAGTATITATSVETTNYKAESISMTFTILKSNLFISFNEVDPKTTSTADFPLNIVTIAGTPVGLSSSNTAVAEVYFSGNVWKVKIKGVGTTDITASHPGNNNFNAAPNVTRTLRVTDGVLPVALIDYTVKIANYTARLDWKLSSEKDNRQFIIYRSGSDKKFVPIGEVLSLGNTNVVRSYSFNDKQPLNGENYYKLSQIDLDGTEKELGIRALNFNLQAATTSVYPNPTLNKVNVVFQANAFQQLTVVDLLGKVLQRHIISPAAASATLDLENYPTGIYVLVLTGNQGRKEIKVVKQ